MMNVLQNVESTNAAPPQVAHSAHSHPMQTRQRSPQKLRGNRQTYPQAPPGGVNQSGMAYNAYRGVYGQQPPQGHGTIHHSY